MALKSLTQQFETHLLMFFYHTKCL